MSRREGRISEPKRRHSRFDREHSPKRYRRDGKPESERLVTEPELDKDRADRGQRHRRRQLQDPLPLEAPLSHDSKIEPGTARKESEIRADGHQGGRRHSTDPSKFPQPRSYFQHDDRANVGQNGRGFSRRTDDERGWWRNSKDHQNDVSINNNASSDAQRRDEKDRETGSDPKPIAPKRPAFREQKLPTDPDKANKADTDPVTPNPHNHNAVGSGRRDERMHNHRQSHKPERSYVGNREWNKGRQDWRGNFTSRDRPTGSSRYRGGDNSFGGGRQGYRPTQGRAEKWKHDLYNDANRSPTPKNEEDQISKIEALLAS